VPRGWPPGRPRAPGQQPRVSALCAVALSCARTEALTPRVGRHRCSQGSDARSCKVRAASSDQGCGRSQRQAKGATVTARASSREAPRGTLSRRCGSSPPASARPGPARQALALRLGAAARRGRALASPRNARSAARPLLQRCRQGPAPASPAPRHRQPNAAAERIFRRGLARRELCWPLHCATALETGACPR